MLKRTEGEVDHVLKSFCLVNKHTAFHVAVIWFDARQFAMVEKALEGASYNHIQPIYWYNSEQNQQLAAHLRGQVKSVSSRFMARSRTSPRTSTCPWTSMSVTTS